MKKTQIENIINEFQAAAISAHGLGAGYAYSAGYLTSILASVLHHHVPSGQIGFILASMTQITERHRALAADAKTA